MRFLIFLSLFFGSQGQAQVESASFIEGRQFEEKLLKWLLNHRYQILRSCLNETQTCAPDDSLRPYLQRTFEALDPRDSLKFMAESEVPDQFITNGSETHRIAVTTQKMAAPIVFNRDRIPKLSMAALAAILFHEFAHHTGLDDGPDRIPDQIGSRIAKHLSQSLLQSSFEEGNLPQVQVGIFRTSLRERYDYPDLKTALTHFSYLTDGVDVLDIPLHVFVAVPACDGPQTVFAQKSEVPRWGINSRTAEGFSVDVTSALTNYCVENNPSPHSVVTASERMFKISFRVSTSGRIDWKSPTIFLKKGEIQDFFDALKTVRISNFMFDSAKPMQAGETLTATADVEFLTTHIPVSCSIAYFRESWPFQIPGVHTLAPFQSCAISKQSGSKYQLKAVLRIPPGLAPGEYSIYGVSFNTNKDPALAVTKNLSFRITGLPSKLTTIRSTQFLGAQTLEKIGAQPLRDSIVYGNGQEFDLVVQLDSALEVNRQILDLGLLVQIGGELKTMRFSAEPKDLGLVIKSTKVAKVGGETRVSYRIAIPNQHQGYNVWGFLVSRVLIEDSGSNWTEIRYPDYDHMALNKSFVDLNR